MEKFAGRLEDSTADMPGDYGNKTITLGRLWAAVLAVKWCEMGPPIYSKDDG
jgi:hypothetical protein